MEKNFPRIGFKMIRRCPGSNNMRTPTLAGAPVQMVIHTDQNLTFDNFGNAYLPYRLATSAESPKTAHNLFVDAAEWPEDIDRERAASALGRAAKRLATEVLAWRIEASKRSSICVNTRSR